MASITFYPTAPYEQWAPELKAILTPADYDGNYAIDETDFIKMWADGHEFIIQLKDGE